MNRKQEFWDVFEKQTEKIPDEVCCCCGHNLGSHIDEDEGWRCHSIASDFYQCECFLRKGRYDNDVINAYDLKRRRTRYIKESREEETAT